MIPRHRPSLGIDATARLALTSADAPTIDELEEELAQLGGIDHAVWLPSARAGIYWATVATDADPTVVGPAFTCSAVHEAVTRAAGEARLLDCAPGSLLMEPADIARAAGHTVVVLCEVFGHPYDLDELPRSSGGGPTLRIVDMAMTIPEAATLDRLDDSDLALVSFGAGKCLSVGAGGAAYTRDPALATELRGRRDASLAEPGRSESLRRAVGTASRTVAHHEHVYRATRSARQALATLRGDGGDPRRSWVGPGTSRAHWQGGPTSLERRITAAILDRAPRIAERRRELAERLRTGLTGVTGVRTPAPSPFALSHGVVRVDATRRAEVRSRLWTAGIDSGRLWRLAPWLDPTEHPGAAAAAAEVITLPLDPRLTDADVDRMADAVGRAVDEAAVGTSAP